MRTKLRNGIWRHQLTSLIKAVTVVWILTAGVVLAQVSGSGSGGGGSDHPAFQPHGQPKTIESPPIVVPAPLSGGTLEKEISPGRGKQRESDPGSEKKVSGSGLRLPERLIDQPDSHTLVVPSGQQAVAARSEQPESLSEGETEAGGGLRQTERLSNQPTDSHTLLNE